jgi:hypothetical protein
MGVCARAVEIAGVERLLWSRLSALATSFVPTVA